jgi:uncharacterized protein YecE (DUF72 family)
MSYEHRGKLAVSRFERDSLAEYAEVFKAVGVDATFYNFPRREFLHQIGDQVPDDFRFGFKVTEAVTIKRYPRIAKSGLKAGQQNPHFLNAELFAMSFLKPCERFVPRWACSCLSSLVSPLRTIRVEIRL